MHSLYCMIGLHCAPYKFTYLLRISLISAIQNVSYADHECRSKFVAEHGVDERIDSRVSKSDEVRRQHREQEVLLQ